MPHDRSRLERLRRPHGGGRLDSLARQHRGRLDCLPSPRGRRHGRDRLARQENLLQRIDTSMGCCHSRIGGRNALDLLISTLALLLGTLASIPCLANR
jgi:hypothetical protein